jgi:large subunit ribosomal protein L35Ae
MNYHIGIRAQASRECLIEFAKMEPLAEGKSLIGKKVLWRNGNGMLGGRIIGFHGKNSVVRAKFKKGLPGQAIGTTVELVL